MSYTNLVGGIGSGFGVESSGLGGGEIASTRQRLLLRLIATPQLGYCITLALCARDHFFCYGTLRCKCPHSWVEDYRTVPHALGCRPS